MLVLGVWLRICRGRGVPLFERSESDSTITDNFRPSNIDFKPVYELQRHRFGLYHIDLPSLSGFRSKDRAPKGLYECALHQFNSPAHMASGKQRVEKHKVRTRYPFARCENNEAQSYALKFAFYTRYLDNVVRSLGNSGIGRLRLCRVAMAWDLTIGDQRIVKRLPSTIGCVM
jgi:hypothetical protein